MAENFAVDAIAQVRAELHALQRKRGKKPVVRPSNPVAEFMKQRRVRIESRRQEEPPPMQD